MSNTEQRTLSGGAIGTGAGAIVGAIAGHTVWGLPSVPPPVRPEDFFTTTTRKPNKPSMIRATRPASRVLRRANKICLLEEKDD